MSGSTDDPVAHAESLLAAQNPQETVRFCRRILLSNPSQIDLRVVVARALVTLGRFDEARVEMLAVVRQFPDRADAYRWLGEACLRAGHRAKAREVLVRALELDPSDDETRALLAESQSSAPVPTETVDRWFDQNARSTVEDGGDDLRVGTDPGSAPESTSPSTELPVESTEVTPPPPPRTEGAPKVKPALPKPMVVAATRHTPLREVTEALDLSDIELVDSAPMTPPIPLGRSDAAPPPEEDDFGSLSAESTLVWSESPNARRIPPPELPPIGPSGTLVMSSSDSSKSGSQVVAGSEAGIVAGPRGIEPAIARSSEEASAPAPSKDGTRRSRGRVFMYVIAAVVAVAGLGAGGYFIATAYVTQASEEAVDEAVIRACEMGDLASLETALQEASSLGAGSARDALRARLLAMRAFDHGIDGGAELAGLLGSLDDSIDSKLARAYVALSEGDVSDVLSTLPDSTADAAGAEVAYLRSWAHHQSGDTLSALADLERPASSFAPRYLTWKMILAAHHGEGADALVSMEPRSRERSPVWEIGHAEVMRILGRADDARDAAGEFLEEFDATASPKQKIRAHLILAESAALNPTECRAQLSAARELGAERLFPRRLAELYADLGDFEVAAEMLAKIPANRRARNSTAPLEVRIAIGSGDLDEAERLLPSLGEGAPAELLRGRVFEARGDHEAATLAYQRAAAEPELALEATTRIVSLHLEMGDAAAAAAAADPIYRPYEEAFAASTPLDSPLPPGFLLSVVRVHLQLKELDRATAAHRLMQVTASSAPETAIAKAGIDLFQAEYTGAFEALNANAAGHERELWYALWLYEAAFRTGHAEVAERAFPLLLVQHREAAMLQLAATTIQLGDFERMEAVLTLLDEALGPRDPRVIAIRGESMVVRGLGAPAAEALGAIADASRTARVWRLLGLALLQAEDSEAATNAFERALGMDADEPWALAALARIDIADGHLSAADTKLERALPQATAPVVRAFARAVEARREFEAGHEAEAASIVEDALQTDPTCSEAYLVLAEMADADRESPIPHLESAIASPMPFPEAVAWLALELPPNDPRGCDLGRRYLTAAPDGQDVRDIERRLRRCD